MPWTALTSMPVEVTLTGVELVLSNRKGEANYAVRSRAVGAVDHAQQQNANLEISAQEVGSSHSGSLAAVFRLFIRRSYHVHFKFSFKLTAPADELRNEAKKQANGADADADEGWVQSLITRIAANVSLELRGLTVKYAEV